MLHRHLTRERYELALEESSSAAARCRRKAGTCARCSSALAETPLAPRLAAWSLPAATIRPADWQAAVRRAIAPSSGAVRRRSRLLRVMATAPVVTALLVASALPAAAETGPDSALYPVRGLEENVRWQVTPESARAEFDADRASSYLWQARTAAARHDREAYQAAMRRFFTWAGRLHADIGKAPPAQRSSARQSVNADLSLVSPMTTSGPDPAAARRAQAIMQEVESESEAGRDRQGQDASGDQRSGASGRGESSGR